MAPSERPAIYTSVDGGGPGQRMRLTVQSSATGGDDPEVATFRGELSNGASIRGSVREHRQSVVIDELTVQNPAGVDASTLRSIATGEILAFVAASLTDFVDWFDEPNAVIEVKSPDGKVHRCTRKHHDRQVARGLRKGWTVLPPSELVEELAKETARQVEQMARAGDAAAKKAKQRGGRAPLTDEHLRDVAVEYLKLQADLGPRGGILQAMSDRRDVPLGTIRDWVRRASEAQFLDRAKQGKVGRNPGPRLRAKGQR